MGAIALDALFGSGAWVITTIVDHTRRNETRYGLQLMRAGGGLPSARLVELLYTMGGRELGATRGAGWSVGRSRAGAGEVRP